MDFARYAHPQRDALVSVTIACLVCRRALVCRVFLTTPRQVMFNVAQLIGVLQDKDGAQSAAECTSATCAAVTRLLLMLFPQFAVPGSRTARNQERNAWVAMQSCGSPVRAAVVQRDSATCDSHDEDGPLPGTADASAWQQTDAQHGGQLAPAWEDPVTAETASEEPQRAAPPSSCAAATFRLRISCCDLLDCDIFSKSDPYVVVSEVAAGGRHEHAVELGRTEVIQDNLNPVFRTCVAVESRPSDAQVRATRVCFVKPLFAYDVGGRSCCFKCLTKTMQRMTFWARPLCCCVSAGLFAALSKL